jgi:hypothetical protein
MSEKQEVHTEEMQAVEPIDIGAAQAAIEADRQQRAESAAREIQAVLARYRCQLVAVPQLTSDGRIVAVSQIMAQ